MGRVEDIINAAKTNEMLSELLHIKKEEEKKQNVLMWVLIVVAAVAAVAGIAYAVYRFFTPDYLEDFDEDFDDDYDDDFFDDEDEDARHRKNCLQPYRRVKASDTVTKAPPAGTMFSHGRSFCWF